MTTPEQNKRTATEWDRQHRDWILTD